MEFHWRVKCWKVLRSVTWLWSFRWHTLQNAWRTFWGIIARSPSWQNKASASWSNILIWNFCCVVFKYGCCWHTVMGSDMFKSDLPSCVTQVAAKRDHRIPTPDDVICFQTTYSCVHPVYSHACRGRVSVYQAKHAGKTIFPTLVELSGKSLKRWTIPVQKVRQMRV